MTNISIFLLAVLIFIVKYGEQSAKFMSIRGDINLAFFPRIDKGDTVGFVYENNYGGFALLMHHCQQRDSSNYPPLIKQRDCTVQSNRSSSANSKHNNHIGEHDPNFPDEQTGTNLIVGKNTEIRPFERTVWANGIVIYIENIPREHDHRSTRILCNDKSLAHYRDLFQFSSSQPGMINFLKGDRNKYEQTMKCIVMVFNQTNYVIAASVFLMTIEDLEPITFTFQSSIFLDTRGVDFINQTSDTTLHDTHIETSFVFRTNGSSECQPNLIMEMVQKKQRILKFTYGNITRAMPSIYVDESHICGVTNELQTESLFLYSCKCK